MHTQHNAALLKKQNIFLTFWTSGPRIPFSLVNISVFVRSRALLIYVRPPIPLRGKERTLRATLSTLLFGPVKSLNRISTSASLLNITAATCVPWSEISKLLISVSVNFFIIPQFLLIMLPDSSRMKARSIGSLHTGPEKQESCRESNISNTKDSINYISKQGPWEFKIQRVAECFWWKVRSLLMWLKTLLSVWYIFSM